MGKLRVLPGAVILACDDFHKRRTPWLLIKTGNALMPDVLAPQIREALTAVRNARPQKTLPRNAHVDMLLAKSRIKRRAEAHPAEATIRRQGTRIGRNRSWMIGVRATNTDLRRGKSAQRAWQQDTFRKLRSLTCVPRRRRQFWVALGEVSVRGLDGFCCPTRWLRAPGFRRAVFAFSRYLGHRSLQTRGNLPKYHAVLRSASGCRAVPTIF
jgi:hypothetical protein